jgi:hypothetical protein
VSSLSEAGGGDRSDIAGGTNNLDFQALSPKFRGTIDTSGMIQACDWKFVK